MPFRSVRCIACLAILLLANCCGSYIKPVSSYLEIKSIIDLGVFEAEAGQAAANGNFLIIF